VPGIGELAILFVVCEICSMIFVALFLNRTSANMKTNLLKYLSLVSFTILMGCQKESKTISNLLLGKWEWVKTIDNQYLKKISNPFTLGFSKTIEFLSNDKMNEYKNDTLIQTSVYSIQINTSNPNKYVLSQNGIIFSPFYMVNDSLIFNEAYVDGQISSYIRK
jgi:hypothetical protein